MRGLDGVTAAGNAAAQRDRIWRATMKQWMEETLLATAGGPCGPSGRAEVRA